MTFFGSTANDAAYNAWLTDRGDETNRGRIEGVNSMMPLVSILIVFGSFLSFDLERMASWRAIYYIIGAATVLIGVLGFFLIEEAPGLRPDRTPLSKTLVYSFRPSTVRQNPRLYLVLAAFALFGISIQIFMPYLLIYYEHRSFLPVFVGSLLMMSGYLTGMAVFGAEIRDLIPENRAGQFQGVRIIGQVFIPGLIGPAIGAYILRNAAEIVNSDGTVSFLPDANIFLAALVVLILLFSILFAVRNRKRDA